MMLSDSRAARIEAPEVTSETVADFGIRTEAARPGGRSPSMDQREQDRRAFLVEVSRRVIASSTERARLLPSPAELGGRGGSSSIRSSRRSTSRSASRRCARDRSRHDGDVQPQPGAAAHAARERDGPGPRRCARAATDRCGAHLVRDDAVRRDVGAPVVARASDAAVRPRHRGRRRNRTRGRCPTRTCPCTRCSCPPTRSPTSSRDWSRRSTDSIPERPSRRHAARRGERRRDAAAGVGPVVGDHMRVVVVPEGEPRPSPRPATSGCSSPAASCALIYDAEDRPEPRPAARRSWSPSAATPERGLPAGQPQLLQPAPHNLLTRWFTAEYATWFDAVPARPGRARRPDPAGRHVEPLPRRGDP